MSLDRHSRQLPGKLTGEGTLVLKAFAPSQRLENENGEMKNKLNTSIHLPLLPTTDVVTNDYRLVFPIIMGCYLFKPGAQTNPSSSFFGQIFVRTTRKAMNTHPDYSLKCKIHGNVGSRYFCVEYIFICFSTFQSYEVFI